MKGCYHCADCRIPLEPTRDNIESERKGYVWGDGLCGECRIARALHNPFPRVELP